MTGTPEVIERTEMLQAEPAVALARLLGVDPPRLRTDGLPLLWHWVYLLERPHQGDLGPDGHPVRGGLPVPPGPRWRRMAAGGRVTLLGPLIVGREATRRSVTVSTVDKQGSTGRLTFVVVRHTVAQGGEVRVVEEQDLVYRDAASLTTPDPTIAAEPAPPTEGEWSLPVDPTLLFRFSALTYNAHRIHYDHDFARDVEGYRGLVTHGPLQALAMVESVRRTGATAMSIDYRFRSPLLGHQGLVASSTGAGPIRTASVRDLTGRVTATGRVEVNQGSDGRTRA